MEQQVRKVSGPLSKFARDSVRFWNRCTKPDAKEFSKIALATGAGFLVLGFVGFFVRLIFIPINHVLVGNKL
ncbi:putative protein transport protein Sec61 subunit gamma [Monocercomonoides exilis]|uniref:putative protein transport protein Sec61 subunit gamma n=1 Tax=Monocercomonoides exilis TaxID=2049356 RepID=UPI003559EADA|nr:putative protein transport protein Sec61 subunit gamma [Monocercomonoides exilis]